jgi:nicotinamidase-related amidase
VSPSLLELHQRSQELTLDASGHNVWKTNRASRSVPAAKTAIILCDMWDNHWSRGAAERVDELAVRVNEVCRAARNQGVWIVHAPSETMDFYAESPARRRILDLPVVALPPLAEHVDPPLPIDDSDEGSDTNETDFPKAWTRQHAAIAIDEERDVISDNGTEIYNFLRYHDIQQVLILGVHTNMCVLRRSFAIKNLVRRGMPVALIRDLTDALYNPAMRPYVSHADGTRLVVEYIEKFWCPSIDSSDLIGGPR